MLKKYKYKLHSEAMRSRNWNLDVLPAALLELRGVVFGKIKLRVMNWGLMTYTCEKSNINTNSIISKI